MIKFFLSRDVKAPAREYGNAGYDFYVPNFNNSLKKAIIEHNNPDNYEFTNEGVLIKPGKDFCIPTGVHTLFTANIALVAENKSGRARKNKFIKGAQIIDHSYEGECFIHIFNISAENQELKYGEKAIQFVPYFIDIEEGQVVTTGSLEDFYKDHMKTRGAGWQGSTGLK